LLGIAFLFSGYQALHFNGTWHLSDYYFYSALRIDSLGLGPLWAVECIAVALPWLEAFLAVALLFNFWLRWTALTSVALLSLFLYSSVIAQLRFTPDSFLVERGHVSAASLVRDATPLLLALAVTVGAFLQKKRQGTVAS
jgi:hypothetical protein